jgi:hypothetical protein
VQPIPTTFRGNRKPVNHYAADHTSYDGDNSPCTYNVGKERQYCGDSHKEEDAYRKLQPMMPDFLVGHPPPRVVVLTSRTGHHNTTNAALSI